VVPTEGSPEEAVTRILRTGALVVSVGAVALALVDSSAGTLRLALSSVALTVLVGMGVWARFRIRRASALGGAVEAELGAPLLSASTAACAPVAMAWALKIADKPGYATAVGAAVWVVLAAVAAEWVAHQSTRTALAEARAVLASLEGGERTAAIGDVIEIAAGERVLHDLRIIHGSIACELWGNPALRARRGEGDPVPAGAIVREGRASARVSAIGRDRAFARLLTDAIERSDRASPGLRRLDRTAPWLAAAVIAMGIALGLFSHGKLGPTAVAGLAAGVSILIPPARRLAVRDQLWGIIEACRRGAAFRDTEAFSRAGGVRTAIFCARGTLVALHPDACDVEPIGNNAPADVLALAAGAELGVTHPLAQSVLRTAQARGVRPIDVRNVVFEPGLGVRGELASGATVVVGSRTFALNAHVTTAEHEERINELERMGRDVAIVARDGRVIGLLALQYPLRAGAMAAVQRLLDIEVEPVILGGAARARLEAIGKAVDIEHVRPEVLPKERSAEVRRVAQSGGPVAVIGRPPVDSATLAAADVAIALNDAGTAPEPAAIALAHDQLVTAVDVLALAQATRARVSATLSVGLAPVVVAALPVAFGLVRANYAPLAALAATMALGVRDLVAAALPEGGRMEEN